MLGTLQNSEKANWKKFVSSLVFAYNSIPHESTGFAPYELMFGRKPKLPIDAMFEEARTEKVNKSAEEYREDLRERIQKAREVVEEHMNRGKQKQKKYYDRKVKGEKLDIGDQVLVKILSRGEGKHKIADKYEEDMSTVTAQPNEEIPVFVVKGNETSKIRTLHRNHLFLVDYKIIDEEKIEPIKEAEEKETEETESVLRDSSLEEGRSTVESSDDEAEVIVLQTRTYGDAHIAAIESEGEDDNSDNEVITAIEEPLQVSDTAETEDEEVQDTDIEDRDAVTAEVSMVEPEVHINIEEAATPVAEAEVVDDNTEVKEIEHSPDPPRKSSRTKKIPPKYEDYVMYGMQNRPYDSRIQALNAIISSGVLSQMDVN